jgi:hypothetical protein
MARPDQVPTICAQWNGIVPEGNPKPVLNLGRQRGEDCSKCPEPLGEARRFSRVAQPENRRSSARKCDHGARTDLGRKGAGTRFRLAQQPEDNALERGGEAGDAFGNRCQREQDDSKSPKRLVVDPVLRIQMHFRTLFVQATNLTRHMSMSRTIFRFSLSSYPSQPNTYRAIRPSVPTISRHHANSAKPCRET